MTGICSRGRRGSTNVPNWRWEDPSLDPYDLRVAGWLASHADSYLKDTVTRNEIARCLRMSGDRVSKSVETLSEMGIIIVGEVQNGAGGGIRWVIEFDFDVWERDPDAGRHTTSGRSPHDQHAGRHTTSSIEHQEEVDQEDLLPRSESFERFWAAYPVKREKKLARDAWFNDLTALDRQAAFGALEPWLKAQDPKYLVYPNRYLKRRRWEDEVTVKARRPSLRELAALERSGT